MKISLNKYVDITRTRATQTSSALVIWQYTTTIKEICFHYLRLNLNYLCLPKYHQLNFITSDYNVFIFEHKAKINLFMTCMRRSLISLLSMKNDDTTHEY